MKQHELQSLEARHKTNIGSHCHPSGAVEALFTGAIDRIRTEAEETITKQKIKAEAEAAKAIAEVKAEAEEKARVYTETIARVKAQAEETIARVKAEAREKARAYADAIAGIKAKVQEKAKAYTDRVAEGKPSVTVGALFSEAIAKQKAKSEAKAAEAIAEIKAEAQDKTRAYTETIAEVKVEAENKITQQKTKSEAEAAEAAARVKVEAEEAIARLRAEATDAITRVKAEVTDALIKAMAEAKEKAGLCTNKIEEAAVKERMEELPVSETIRRMARSSAGLPHEKSIYAFETLFCDLLQNEPLELCAKDIMQKEVIWASPDDSIQQTFAKMQQHDVGYIMVGHEGLLEGIISKSDLTGAVSPYLRPMFAKWRRPMDDITLQIRIKWIMSKPVHTISSRMSLATIMTNMCRSRVLCLPVVDAKDEVKGLVAETNIFEAVLNLMQAKCFTSDKVRQEQPAFAHPTTARAELEI